MTAGESDGRAWKLDSASASRRPGAARSTAAGPAPRPNGHHKDLALVRTAGRCRPPPAAGGPGNWDSLGLAMTPSPWQAGESGF